MDPITILYIIVSVVVGVVVGRLSVASRIKSALSDAASLQAQLTEVERSAAAERERRMILEEQLNGLRRDAQKLKDESDTLRTRLETEIDHRAKAENEARRVPTLERLLEGADNARNGLLDEVRQLEIDLAEARQALVNERQTAAEKIQILEDAKKQLTTVFENTASKLLEEKSERFTRLNTSNMENLLKPFGEEMQNFKRKVEEVYDRESKERFSLGREVEKLVNATTQIGEQANNLTKALTSNSKVQGDWGEEVLERILETCGLARDREFFVQEYLRDTDGKPLTNSEGKRMQPDIILQYPDERQVIIDSKVSLTDYNRYVNAASDDERTLAADAHVTSLKNHIIGLSQRHYQDHAPALDFVMLFVPVEAAYVTAMQLDPRLWHFAFERRILLTSPTNLVVAMKLIADLWKRDKQAKNFEKIVERGGHLYDKFCLLVQTLTDIGAHLGKAEKSYVQALNHITDGPGNLISQVEKLKKLGSSAKKSLPSIEQVAKSADGLTLVTGKSLPVASGPSQDDAQLLKEEDTPKAAKSTLFE